VAAGGLVLDPAPAARRGRVLPTIGRLEPVEATADDRAAALLDVRGSADADDLARWSGGGSVGSTVAAHVLADASRRLAALVTDYHARFPLRPGLAKAEAASTIGIGPDALGDATGTAGVVEVGPYLARPEHRPALTEDQSAAWETVRAELADAGNAPPRLSDLDLDDEVVHFLIREEELVDVGGFAYLPGTLDALVSGLSDLGEGWTVAEFRDHAGISRKYAVPLLEWLDARSITRRTGDTRSLR
jgi:selenocysteine-specific elongation factor